ncbi:MAG: YkoF family thiamine/hydroxymethylpyrimidine-binding protein [Woeseiaceae bacterium]|nr:YkoF family thiamine/hydroxymethylpyrimidine-binding protein [Woeseiaceae bacterium]
MRIAVDISLYPIADEFLPPIKDIVERLNAKPSVQVETNAMSTQIRGEYDAVMSVLDEEIRTTFTQCPKAVFVVKILNNPLED